MSSKLWLSVMYSVLPLTVSRLFANSSPKACLAASCDEKETVVCIFEDIASRLIGPTDSMICRPFRLMRSLKKFTTSSTCVDGGKPVTRKVCCLESIVGLPSLNSHKRTNCMG